MELGFLDLDKFKSPQVYSIVNFVLGFEDLRSSIEKGLEFRKTLYSETVFRKDLPIDLCFRVTLLKKRTRKYTYI